MLRRLGDEGKKGEVEVGVEAVEKGWANNFEVAELLLPFQNLAELGKSAEGEELTRACGGTGL